jgi:hypothetical protein
MTRAIDVHTPIGRSLTVRVEGLTYATRFRLAFIRRRASACHSLGDALSLVWARRVVDDSEKVVDSRRAERAREDIRPAALERRPHLTLQRHVAVVDLDVDDGSMLPGPGPEGGILFDLFRNDQLKLVVVKQARLGPPDDFCSHISPRLNRGAADGISYCCLLLLL